MIRATFSMNLVVLISTSKFFPWVFRRDGLNENHRQKMGQHRRTKILLAIFYREKAVAKCWKTTKRWAGILRIFWSKFWMMRANFVKFCKILGPYRLQNFGKDLDHVCAPILGQILENFDFRNFVKIVKNVIDKPPWRNFGVRIEKLRPSRSIQILDKIYNWGDIQNLPKSKIWSLGLRYPKFGFELGLRISNISNLNRQNGRNLKTKNQEFRHGGLS